MKIKYIQLFLGIILTNISYAQEQKIESNTPVSESINILQQNDNKIESPNLSKEIKIKLPAKKVEFIDEPIAENIKIDNDTQQNNLEKPKSSKKPIDKKSKTDKKDKLEEAKHQEISKKTEEDKKQDAKQKDIESTKFNDTIAAYGKIITKKKIDEYLTAWVVEKNTKRIILYTTNNQNIVLAGIAWDVKTKENLNKQFDNYMFAQNKIDNKDKENIYSTQPNKNKIFQTPEAISTLNSLDGIKEGNGNVIDTLYIIFDPKCSYCRQAYQKSRKYITSGKSIKWIPALVLGNSIESQMQAAAILQADSNDQANILKRILGDKEQSNLKPNSKTLNSLQKNKDYFFAAVKNSNIPQAGVPIGFFFDKNKGKPRVLMGLSEDEILDDIFKSMK